MQRAPSWPYAAGPGHVAGAGYTHGGLWAHTAGLRAQAAGPGGVGGLWATRPCAGGPGKLNWRPLVLACHAILAPTACCAAGGYTASPYRRTRHLRPPELTLGIWPPPQSPIQWPGLTLRHASRDGASGGTAPFAHGHPRTRTSAHTWMLELTELMSRAPRGAGSLLQADIGPGPQGRYWGGTSTQDCGWF